MEEIWKDIRGYEGFYMINNFGEVRSLNSNIIIKPYKLKNGYVAVHLYKNKYRKNCLLHRLVFEAFYRKLLPNEQAHHLNQVKTDNRSINIVARDKFEHNSFHHKDNVTSEQTKKKQSKAHKGFKHSQQSKKKISESKIGKKRSPETTKKIVQTRRLKRLQQQ